MITTRTNIASTCATILALLCVAGSASAQGAGETPARMLYARVPAVVDSFTLTERVAIRGTATDSLYRFRDGSRTIVSVIVYDIVDGSKVGPDPQKWSVSEGEKFKDVQEVRRGRGELDAYTVAFSDSVRVAVPGGDVLEHRIAVPARYPNGAIVVDMQFLYVIDGKFVKVRATIPSVGWEQSRVPLFARALATQLVRNP